jgi:hypothetical protein
MHCKYKSWELKCTYVRNLSLCANMKIVFVNIWLFYISHKYISFFTFIFTILLYIITNSPNIAHHVLISIFVIIDLAPARGWTFCHVVVKSMVIKCINIITHLAESSPTSRCKVNYYKYRNQNMVCNVRSYMKSLYVLSRCNVFICTLVYIISFICW